MMLTLVSRGNLWFTKWLGNNQFKGFFTGSWKRRIRSDTDTDEDKDTDIFKIKTHGSA